MALTIKKVAALKTPGRHSDEHGLYLQITPAGVKSWLFHYQRAGRSRWMGLGATHVINRDEARESARKARQRLLNGIDPLDARQSERAARALEAARMLTFE